MCCINGWKKLLILGFEIDSIPWGSGFTFHNFGAVYMEPICGILGSKLAGREDDGRKGGSLPVTPCKVWENPEEEEEEKVGKENK